MSVSSSSSSSGPTVQLTGLASGINTGDIIDKLMSIERRPIDQMSAQKAKINLQQTQMDGLQDRVTKLNTAIKTLTAPSVLDDDPFEKKSTASSNESLVTATATDDASVQSFTVQVTSLATATRASSVTGLGQVITGATPVSQLAGGNVTAGNFTIYVNGAATTIAVDPTLDTVNDILTDIQGVAGITGATVTAGGQIQITFAGGTNVQLGANGDTTNFLRSTFLSTGVRTGTSITSAIGLSSINLTADIENNALARLQTAVAAGSTFTIGTASFSTGGGKSLADLINEINTNSDAGVTASYNMATNKIDMIAKETGSDLITLADTAGNFLTAMGLISGGDTTASQTAGVNAVFKLNGTTLYSNSNNVTENVTGLAGITLDLNQASPGTDVTITIDRDTEPLIEAIKDFITQFNSVMTFIDQQTDSESKTAQLKGDGGLRRFKSQLRTTVTDYVASLTKYSSLPLIGISTGAVTGAAAASSQLQFNESTFEAALNDDSTEVKSLMVGASGIFTQLFTYTDAALHDDPDDSLDGLFPARKNSNDARIKDIDDAIERMQTRLEKREQFLRAQFNAMEQLISQSNSQGAALTNLANQLSANGGN